MVAFPVRTRRTASRSSCVATSVPPIDPAGPTPSGFAEVGLGDVRVTETVAAAASTWPAASDGAAGGHRLDVVLSRLRYEPGERDRQDEELASTAASSLPDAAPFRPRRARRGSTPTPATTSSTRCSGPPPTAPRSRRRATSPVTSARAPRGPSTATRPRPRHGPPAIGPPGGAVARRRAAPAPSPSTGLGAHGRRRRPALGSHPPEPRGRRRDGRGHRPCPRSTARPMRRGADGDHPVRARRRAGACASMVEEVRRTHGRPR